MLGIFGCNNHHYGEKKKTCRIKTIPYVEKDKVTVERMVKQECLHDGCNKTKKEWERVDEINENLVENIVKDSSTGKIVLQPIFEGIKQEKIRVNPGETADLDFISEMGLDIKVSLE